jgi:Tol biopolymer transport system component
MRLDELARSATDALVERSLPDVETGLADLRRTRRRRVTGRLAAAGVAVAVVAGGWTVLKDDSGTPEPAGPNARNGALVIADGGHAVAILEGDAEFEEPPDLARSADLSFTADGEEMVYQNLEQQIVARDVATRETRVLGPCEEEAICKYALSPDEQWLAQTAGHEVFLTQVGGKDRRTFSALVDAADIAWSPEGDRLAVAGWNGVQVIDIDETIPDTLVAQDGFNYYRHVAWSPDGQSVAFVEMSPIQSTSAAYPSTYVLRVVPVDSHDPTSVADLGDCLCSGGPVPSFAWAPDGSALAYTRVAGPAHDARPDGVHLIRPDGTGYEKLSDGQGSLAWQPLVSD